jgi:transposase-like protein
MTGAGALKVRAPRVDDGREGHRFSSYILPRYARKSPKVADVLPVLYLRGLSTGDFAPALARFFGSDAGLSATSITRLVETWGEYTAFTRRDLSTSDFVYAWADEVHFRIRLEEDRLSCLVVIGVKADGTRELLACSDGYRESTESWAGVLRNLKHRGMTAPAVAVGDGALGFWSALGDVFPETAEQRCRVHKTTNILDALPKRLHRQAKTAIHDIYLAESTFATVRARTRVTKGPGSRRRGLVMAYKLLDAAENRWRKVNSPELVMQVRAGIQFKDGNRVERRTDQTRDAA